MSGAGGWVGARLTWPGAALSAITSRSASPITAPQAPVVEDADRVPNDPEATRWRRAARAHQTHWRESHGWPVGSKEGYKRANPLIGSVIEREFAEQTGANFLTPAAWRAATRRIERKQYAETLDRNRLFADLLSSMPLAFNLFGPLQGAPTLAATLVRRWLGGELVPESAQVEVEFEWSPGRDNVVWTGDRTAADVALLVQTTSHRHLVCIETKYHEASSARTSSASPSQPHTDLMLRPTNKRDRRLELTLEHGLFGEETLERVIGSELEQLWRDHLLALSCGGGPNKVDTARYVVIAPAANPVWRRLAAAYQEVLSEPARSTFEFLTIEQLHEHWGRDCYWAPAVRARYLDVIPN